MRIASAFAVLVAAGALAAQPTRPEFELTSCAARGRLAWSGHTVVFDLDAPVPRDDHIVDDTQGRVYDIGLTWNTEPDTMTGEMLTATFFWRIPKNDLDGPRYVISAERPTPDGIVFTLRQNGNETVIRKSPVCRLEKGFSCKLEDIGKHLHLLKVEDLDPSRKNSAKQASQSTTPAVTPPAAASAEATRAKGQEARQP
jgi:hypothetical protein